MSRWILNTVENYHLPLDTEDPQYDFSQESGPEETYLMLKQGLFASYFVACPSALLRLCQLTNWSAIFRKACANVAHGLDWQIT